MNDIATPAAKTVYPPADPSPNFPGIEEAIGAIWEQEGTFQRSIDRRREEGAPEFVFYDGPPFANGLPHYGHIVTGFVKDLVPRYQTMRGKMVERRFGWDCHGLPAELHAEAELKLSGRREILKYGMARFNEHCRNSVMQFRGDWEYYVNRSARWVDFDNDYRTMDLSYMESTMWAFKQLWDKGLVYEGYRVVPYSWAAQTPLSQSETRLDNSYRARQDPALTVGFLLDGDTNTRLLAWTTTPWTLPSNMGLAVKPDADYALMEKDGERVILAESSREHYAPELEGYRTVGGMKGTELVGRTYAPLFPFFADRKADGAFRVVAADFIELGEGTGVVHMAPAFGEDDLNVGQKEGLPVVDPVDLEGNFTGEVPPYAGQNVFAANKDIIRDLKASGVVFRHETYDHNYPHCWRTDQPLIYKAMPSWYIAVTKFRDRMVELNKDITWIPEHVGEGIFGNWLANARDWNVGRNRFWGAPIPVWKSDNPDYPRTDCYGSLDEIERDFGVRPTDLHRPYVDELTRPNPDDPTGKSTMRRVDDVLDCWFESGSMPFCQVHYPFENKEWFDSHFPGDFIVEYVGQTRGWFYTLMVMSTALFDRAPFRIAICHGVVLDENKQKLSKRLKNYPDPVEMFNTHGADALRWYMVSSPLLVRRRSRHAQGRPRHRRGGAFRAAADLERLFVLHALRQYRRHPRQAGDDGGRRTRPLHPRQDGGAGARRRNGDGQVRPCRRVQCAARVHRGAQQLVHPPFARALLEEREGCRQAGGLRHALHGAGHPDADHGAVPAFRDRPHPPCAGRTAKACISPTGRMPRRSPSTRRSSRAWIWRGRSPRPPPRSARRRTCAIVCRWPR